MMNLIPNEHWEHNSADLVRGLIAALSMRRQTYVRELQIPGIGACVATTSARSAIVVALRALRLPAGASIAVPLYCCPVVLSAIKMAGHRARFIDVDPETYCLSPADLAAKSREVDAVIAVHMFGNMCDMAALPKAAPQKPVIEDCAQALGSRFRGREAGTHGDIAVFSFRSGKYVSAGEGGALCSRNAELQSRISDLVAKLPVASRAQEAVHVFKTSLRSLLRRRPFWGAIGNRLWSAYNERVSYTSQAPVVLGQIYEADFRTVRRRLPRIASQVKRQRDNASYYSQILRVPERALCAEPDEAYFNRLQFPILLSGSEECEQLRNLLRQRGISAARPYRNIVEIARAEHGYSGDCPQAERIAESVLVIPCHNALRARDVKHIANAINDTWTTLSNENKASVVRTVVMQPQ